MGQATVTAPAHLMTEEKHAMAVELRVRGHTLAEIAAQMGYSSASGAYAAIRTAMERVTVPPCEDLRRITIARLEKVYKPLAVKVEAHLSDPEKPITGNVLKGVDRIVSIQLAIARMAGLDLSAKVQQAQGDDDPLDTAEQGPVVDRETQLTQIIARLQERADAEARKKAEQASSMAEPAVKEVLEHIE